MAWIDLTGLGTYHKKIKEWIEKNKYIHPANHPATMIIQDNLNQFVSKEQKNIWNNKLDADANAVSASKLQTPVKINGVNFDGSRDIEIYSTVFKEMKYYLRLEPNTSVINMPVEIRNKEGFLSVYADGIKLIENVHYVADFQSKTITISNAYKRSIDLEFVFLYFTNTNNPNMPHLDKLVIDVNRKTIKSNKVDIKLYNGNNPMNSFGTNKNSGYTDNDVAYNSEEGFFYIGKNNELINVNLKDYDLFNGVKKVSFELIMSQTNIASIWSNPMFITTHNSLTTNTNDSDFRLRNGVRLEFAEKNGKFHIYPSPHSGQAQFLATEKIIDDRPHSVLITIEGGTVTLYFDYVKIGFFTMPQLSKITFLGLNRANNTNRCCNMKIYGLKVWKDVALTEEEVGLLNNGGDI